MQVEAPVGRPVLRVEVPIHQELRKREEAKDHRVRPHFPTTLSRHGLSYARHIGSDIDVVLVSEIFDLQTELAVHLRL
jgi:hypothetical protein